MNTFVLILFIYWGSGTPVSMEFNDEPACISAGKSFKEKIPLYERVYFVCMPKGSKK